MVMTTFLSEQGRRGIKKLVKKTSSGFFYFDTSLRSWVRDNSLALVPGLCCISREDVKTVLENYLGCRVSDSFLD